jgi:predicted aminopeptidase
MLSDVKTFTVRDLDRQPAQVLDACDKEGVVRIRRRNGRSYTVRPESNATRKVAWRQLLAEHRARIKEIFPSPMGRKQARVVDQMLAGE